MTDSIFQKCPYCGGDLIKAKDRLVCLDCGREGRAPAEPGVPEPQIKTFSSHKKRAASPAPILPQETPKEPKILKEEIILPAPSRTEPKSEERIGTTGVVASKDGKEKLKKAFLPPDLQFEEIKNFSLKKDWKDSYKLKMVYPVIIKNIKILLKTFVENFKFNFQKVLDNLRGKKEL